MKLISFKRYMTSADETPAFRRIIALLLQGIGLHSVEGSRDDYDRFRADLEHIQGATGAEASVDELLVAAGSALQALKDYNQRTSRYLRLQSAELQNMIGMLTQTVVTIGSGSERSSTRLQEIAKQLEHVSVIEDVQKLKLRMGDCLESVREEAKRQKTEGGALAESIGQEVRRSQQRITAIHNPEVDSCTGLPKRATAELYMHESLEKPGARFVLTAVAQRIHAINARYGYAVGDHVLDVMCSHFKSHLSADDHLFRWTGPGIVAVLEREESLDRVRGEIRRIAEERLEKLFDIGGRSVLIRVSAGWSLIPLTAPVAEIAKHIDTFVASQLPDNG